MRLRLSRVVRRSVTVAIGLVDFVDALLDPLGTAFGRRLPARDPAPRRRVHVDARGDVVRDLDGHDR